MASSLSTRISEMTSRKAPSRGAPNRATFLAMKEEVAQALRDGWPVKTVWETLREEGKVAYSYQSFLTYVNSLIRRKPDEPPPEPKSPTPPGVNGFRFNPIPRKEDLL